MTLNLKMIRDKNPVDSNTFLQRYNKLKHVYSLTDFHVALRILQTIEEFNSVTVYCFM